MVYRDGAWSYLYRSLVPAGHLLAWGGVQLALDAPTGDLLVLVGTAGVSAQLALFRHTPGGARVAVGGPVDGYAGHYRLGLDAAGVPTVGYQFLKLVVEDSGYRYHVPVPRVRRYSAPAGAWQDVGDVEAFLAGARLNATQPSCHFGVAPDGAPLWLAHSADPAGGVLALARHAIGAWQVLPLPVAWNGTLGPVGTGLAIDPRSGAPHVVVGTAGVGQPWFFDVLRLAGGAWTRVGASVKGPLVDVTLGPAGMPWLAAYTYMAPSRLTMFRGWVGVQLRPLCTAGALGSCRATPRLRTSPTW